MRALDIAIIVCGLLQSGGLSASAQTPACPEPCPTGEAGIIVESVVKGTQADKLGILPGDRLLYWVSGSAKGQFETPFVLPYVRFEQASRGLVIVHGISGNKPRLWRFGSDVWGAVVRPNLSGPLLTIANEAAGLLSASQPARAAERFQAAAPQARKQGPAWLTLWFVSRAGQALFDARQWERADALYEEAIQEATAADSITKGELLRQRAGGFEYREDLNNASKYYELVLQDWQSFRPESMVVAQSLLLLANVDLRRFDFDEAESHLRHALAIIEKLAPVSVQMVSVLDDFGILFEERGNFVKAGDYYAKALVIEERYRPGSRQVAAILTHLGTMAHWQGNLREAEAYHSRALAIAEKLERNVLQIADILSNLGHCARDRGDPARAEEYQKRGLLLRQGIERTSLSVAYSLASLGEVARIRGDLLKAEEYYHQASAMAITVNAPAADVAKFLIGEAEVLRDRHDFHRAEELYREALGIFDKVMPGSIVRAESLADLAGVLRQEQQFDNAARLYQSSLEALTKTSYLAGYGEQRSRYRATHSRYYREYAEMLLAVGQPDVAFQVLDGSRAQTLREMLLETHVDVRQGADPSLLERQSELQSMIHAKSKYRVRLASSQDRNEALSATDAEIEDLIAKYEQVNAQLRINSPNYAALTEPQPLAVTKVQEFLDSSTILIEYALGDERSFVWLVTANALNVYELPKRAAIERTARRMYAALTTGSEDSNRTAARHPVSSSRRVTEYDLVSGELSRMILGPVASQLEHKRLVVVADGALAYVPFAALPSPTDSTLPLIAEHEIVSLPSASVLAELRRAREARPQPTREVAVLADPVFEPTDERVIQKMPPSAQEALRKATPIKRLSPGKSTSGDRLTRSASDVGLQRNGGVYLQRLLHSREEAEAIMAVTPPGKRMKAIDFRATRDMAMNATLGQYRIVHFATHGLVDSKNPELSGLVFSLVNEQGRPQDGFLSLEDIYNLRLPSDLVVLSACETALGEQISGEGLIGLTRGFMYAGAKRVVASLWAVNDLATAELMAGFYKAMEQEGLPPAAALRKAQLSMWKQRRWHSPYYWAGFQIQGDWK